MTMVYIFSKSFFKLDIEKAASSIFLKEKIFSFVPYVKKGESAELVSEFISSNYIKDPPTHFIVFSEYMNLKRAVIDMAKGKGVKVWMSPPYPDNVKEAEVFVFNPLLYIPELVERSMSKPFVKAVINFPDIDFVENESLELISQVFEVTGMDISYYDVSPNPKGFMANILLVKHIDGQNFITPVSVSGCRFPPYGVLLGTNGRFGLFEPGINEIKKCLSDPISVNVFNPEKREKAGI